MKLNRIVCLRFSFFFSLRWASGRMDSIRFVRIYSIKFFLPPPRVQMFMFCSKFKLTDPRRLVISKYFHLIRSRRRYLARSSFLSLTLRSARARARVLRAIMRVFTRVSFGTFYVRASFSGAVDLHSPSTIVHKVLLPRQRVK